MQTTTDATLTDKVREAAHRLTGAPYDYDPLMDRVGNWPGAPRARPAH